MQFVDIHGSAKAKMVPASCLNDAIDVRRGRSPAGPWGLGQGLTRTT